MKEGLSVIICCYNSSATIGRVLEYLQGQEGMEDIDWEVILVNNASKDQTVEVARSAWSHERIPLHIVDEQKPGLSHARRKGLETVAYSIVVFVDDDNLLDAMYLSRAFTLMKTHPELGMAGGEGVAISSVDIPSWFKEHQAAYAVGPQADRAGYLPELRTYLYGAGVVIRKEAWDRIQERGFRFLLSGRKGKSLSSGEDSEMTSAFKMAGYKLWYDPDMRFEHIIAPPRLEWHHLLKLAREFGKSAVVLNFYKVPLRNYRGWKRAKIDFWIPGMAVAMKNYLKFLPAYLRLRSHYQEGRSLEFSYQYHKGHLAQKISMVFAFPALRKKVKQMAEKLEGINEDP